MNAGFRLAYPSWGNWPGRVRRGLKWTALAAGAALVLACPYYVLDEEAVAVVPPVADAGGEEAAQVIAPAEAEAVEAAASPAGGGEPWQRVERGVVELYIPTMGNLRARRTSKLAAQVPGRVEAVLVEIGDAVKAGQPLVRLDPAFYEIEVEQREAEVEGARIALADAELLLTRLSGLWNGGKDSAISRQALDEAQARRDGMESRVRQAEEALRFSRRRLGETVVRAPYEGLITARYVDPGESVASHPLLEIQDAQTLELIFTMPQESLERVEAGTPVEFRVAGVPGRVGRAVVEAVYPAVDEATRAFTSRALVDNAGLEFMPGMLAQVGVLGGRVEGALHVPRRSLTRQADGWSVMVLRDGHPVLQKVEVGLISMDAAEILSGLGENDRVMVPRSGA